MQPKKAKQANVCWTLSNISDRKKAKNHSNKLNCQHPDTLDFHKYDKNCSYFAIKRRKVYFPAS